MDKKGSLHLNETFRNTLPSGCNVKIWSLFPGSNCCVVT